MATTPLQYVLWLLAPALLVFVSIQLLRRGMRQRFTFFFTYTVFQIVVVAVNFAVYHYADQYYYQTYWVNMALSVMLEFLVIYEVFSYVIRPYPGLRDLGTMLFRWAVFLLLLVGGISVASGMGATRLTSEIVNLERAVRLVECGLLLFVVMCSTHLGISWRNVACGISFGFGLFAAADLVMYNLRASQGPEWSRALSVVPAVVYNLSVLVWFGYSLMPQSASVRNEITYRPAFDRWNQAAMLIMNSGSKPQEAHTYISDIEHTVEEVLAHSKAR
jgi:hypothetical protein